MKKIECEVCGSQRLVKEAGRFICRDCGVEYSLPELQSQIIDSPIERNQRLFKRAKDLFRAREYEAARQVYQRLAERGDLSAEFYEKLCEAHLEPLRKDCRSAILTSFQHSLENLWNRDPDRYFKQASQMLGEIIVFGLTVEEIYEEKFQSKAARLESTSMQTLKKEHEKMQEGAGAAWLLMDQAAHLCAETAGDLSKASSYFWELVDAILDDLSINQKRGTIALGDVQEERMYFAKLKDGAKETEEVN